MTRTLIVEDDPNFSDTLSQLLAHEGHEVTVHHEAKTAVAEIEDRVPMDLAIVDYWLGSSTSGQVLAALRRHRPGVRVLLITGGSHEVSVETTRWLGALDGIDGCLQKPFARRDMLAMLEQLGL